jgi:hypothetical protein
VTDPSERVLTCSTCGAQYPARQDVPFEEFFAQMVSFAKHVKTHLDEVEQAIAERAGTES